MWEKPIYSQSQIKKAGKTFFRLDTSPAEDLASLVIVNNWRASHAFPLNTITCHLKRIAGGNAIVVQRLKRFESILQKLLRFPEMSLERMQDLGGCRVIVDNIEEVYTVVDKYKNSRVRHILKNTHDYIKNPKPSGYRSYHMVYKYHSDRSDVYNHNMLIEIQVRTKLQHIWATAVETLGIYTKSHLKSSIGDSDILRFLSLTSSLFALKENMPLVPNTPTSSSEIIKEILLINQRTHIINTLKAIRVAVNYMKEKKKAGSQYFLLILNFKTSRLSVKQYKISEIDEATKTYDQIESNNSTEINAVLVSASSFSALRSAYPNYFSDIGEYIKLVEESFTIDCFM